MTHGRPWNGEHSIMLNVTWRRFDQSAKQLVVGHATMKYLDVGLPTVHHLYIVSNMLVASEWLGATENSRHLIVSFIVL